MYLMPKCNNARASTWHSRGEEKMMSCLQRFAMRCRSSPSENQHSSTGYTVKGRRRRISGLGSLDIKRKTRGEKLSASRASGEARTRRNLASRQWLFRQLHRRPRRHHLSLTGR